MLAKDYFQEKRKKNSVCFKKSISVNKRAKKKIHM